jgi:hypothetical protein
MHGIAERGEDGLDEGERPAGPLQHALGAVAILDIGGMDLDREQSAVGVIQDVTLAPVDLFAVRGAYAAPPGPRSPLTIAFDPPF